jgi:hypothetical protein
MAKATKKQLKSANAAMATVEGTYFAQGADGGRLLKPYSLTAPIPIDRVHQALPIFKRMYLKQHPLSPEPSLLSKQYPDAVSVHEHNLVKLELPDGMAPVRQVSLMTEEQLRGYVEQQGIKLYPELYPTIVELRDALHQWEVDENLFYKKQEERYAAIKDELDLVAQTIGVLSTDQQAGEDVSTEESSVAEEV